MDTKQIGVIPPISPVAFQNLIFPHIIALGFLVKFTVCLQMLRLILSLAVLSRSLSRHTTQSEELSTSLMTKEMLNLH